MLAPVKTRGGYSLLEMMVVVAIVGILAAVAVPNFITWNQKYKLKSDVANLAGTLALARMTAINQNVPVVVTVTQTPPAPVVVTFTNFISGAAIPGLSSITMDRNNQLTDAVGGAAVSPQDLRFNNMGLWVDTANVNNICIPGACGSGSQVLNFRNPGGLNNFRIVVLQTGKVIWCYIPTCTQ